MKNIWNEGKTYEETAREIQQLNCNLLAGMYSKYSLGKQTVLEMGCGTGYLTESLSQIKNVEKIMAFDLSKEMLDVAKAKKILNTIFINISFNALETEEVFTSFVSNAAFHWLFPNYSRALDKINSLLKKDSFVYIATAGKNKDSEEYDNMMNDVLLDINPTYESFSKRRLSIIDIKNLIKNTNFILEDVFLVSREVVCTPFEFVQWLFASGCSFKEEMPNDKEKLFIKLEKANFKNICHWTTFFLLKKR
ncbi:MAG: methyltransferase domain-containing protein [Proteobacteria bacterium]|nr:methyltransferase domain-containing protein [Pseudomonadota bacterium]